MKKQQIPLKNSLILLLTATIWGIAFVAQSEGGEAVGPLTFNATRNIIGSLVLIPVILLLNKINPQSNSADFTESDRQPMASSCSNPFSRNKTLIAGGIICGICLCLASNFQQFGIQYTSVGKAGFLTACYIIIVPILGLFITKDRWSKNVLHPVSGLRNPHCYPSHNSGASQSFFIQWCLGRYSLCRRYVLRCRLHPPDRGPEKYEPNRSLPDSQSGILHLCPRRLDYLRTEIKHPGNHRLCGNVRGYRSCPAAAERNCQ